MNPVPVIVGQQVAQSATDETGLINQAFKLTILIGLALAIATGIFLIMNLTTIFDGLVQAGSDTVAFITTPISTVGAIFTGLISALPFGRGLRLAYLGQLGN
jgi:hypothetical protein